MRIALEPVSSRTTIQEGVYQQLRNALMAGIGWELRSPGTLSAAHFTRMAVERAVSLTISAEKVAAAFSDLKPGTYQAIHDISISNEMQVAPQTPASNKVRAIGRHTRPRIERLSELLDLS